MQGNVSSAVKRFGLVTVHRDVLSAGSSALPDACELVDGTWQVLLALTKQSLFLA